jgi:lysophospholipase L1-like esterase
MQQAAWVNNPQSLVMMRPGTKVSFLGDSITAGPTGGWYQDLIQHARMRYGATAPTFTAHGVGGVTIAGTLSNGQVTAVIADAPDVVFVELGTNNLVGAVYATILADATSVIATLRASLPNVKMAWLSVWARGEQWGPDPSQAMIDVVTQGVKDACAANNVQFIDNHSVQQAYEMTYNTPAPGVYQGITTVDGIHPTWLGRPKLARNVINSIFWLATTSPNIDVTPSWSPTVDSGITWAFWLESRNLTPAPLSSWGPFSTFAGSPTVVAGGWFNGRNCVRFSGSDVMTASLSTPAGAKTVIALFKCAGVPANGNYYSLLTLTNGVVTTEVIPAFTGGTKPLVMVNCDQKKTGSDGFSVIGTNDIADSETPPWPFRLACTFAGGSSTDPAQYTFTWAGAPCTSVQQAGFLAEALTCLCALGGRMEDGATLSQPFAGDLVALGVTNSIPTSLQLAQVDQYLRLWYGP